jgi:ubiquinone/menaquinone biosynthesis C-methylase UbiE
MRLSGAMDRYLGVGAGQRALDVGCGTGHQLKALRERGYRVAGVDGSAAMLEYARSNNPGAELRQADLGGLPYDDASFDVVICIEVLRYLEDPQPCLGEIARVLRPGGLCLATATPAFNLNAYAAVNRVALAFPWLGLTPLKQFFTTSTRLRSRMTNAGFADVHVHGVYWGPLNWAERLWPGSASGFLRRWESIDRAVADRPVMRGLSNMFLVKAARAR